MPTMSTRLKTWLNGDPVGEDSFGNKYYQERKVPAGRRRRRWVVYSGDEEASRVPPLWHAWLHYTLDQAPDDAAIEHHPWEKAHLPNLTGTVAAYRPPGHTLEGGKRSPATGDYEPWRPE